MTETDLEQALLYLARDVDELSCALEEVTGDEAAYVADARSFSESGVLTNDAGMVVRTENAEFQVTIVRSR
ncbi:hypothetical protein F4561_005215 [Lipingzhangella halophila]|uniref:Uncharacterized protein n=1 Tax=Lipingzhangella halophila TaxID=1783352 RepID=A0A7W7W609_9ACTN|nr:hypothetical protein [Lipingzhangella halophila]MBB4934395.1 hypothetical protein [Lipingzhangella halophila]